jgi:aspartate kinase
MPQAEPNRWIVQKYGGTSVGKLLSNITDSIIPTQRKSHNVAVVCSARSGTTKSKGTTSLLLDAIQVATAAGSDLADLDLIIDVVKEDHLAAAQKHIGNNDLVTLRSIQLDIETDCEKVRTLLKATSMLGEISGRTTDRVLAIGETLSCRIVAGSLMTKV